MTTRYCGSCGAATTGAAYCTSCGQPLEGATAAPPPAPAEPAGGTTTQHLPPAPPPVARPGVNPFVGVPVTDYVRDAAAVFCLFAALGMPWDNPVLSESGADHWWVVLSVLLSVASLALPYVGRAGAVPGWTHQHVTLAKLAANLPLVACAVAALVNELVHLGDDSEGGLGTGIGMALAGALLAAQPRQADEDPYHLDDKRWNLAATVAAVATVAVGVLTYLGWVVDNLVDDTGLFDDVARFLGGTAMTVVMFLVVVGWPALASLGGDPVWRRVFATVGFTVLVVALFALADDGQGLFSMFEVEKWNTPAAGVFVLGAAAALAVSRPRGRLAHGRTTHPVTSWVDTAAAALLVAAAGLAVAVVEVVLALVVLEEVEAAYVVVAVLAALSAVLALVARSMLRDVRARRTTVLGLVAGALVLGMIALGVTDGEDLFAPRVDGWLTAAALVLPALAAFALTVPGDVRRTLGPLVTPRTVPPGHPPPTAPPPTAPPPTAPPPTAPPPTAPPPAPPAEG